MALYIVTKDGKNMEWHIGEKIRMPNSGVDHHNLMQSVVEIQADGDELYKINEVCHETIPFAWRKLDGRDSLRRVQRWFGDHAKFIFANVVL